MAVTEGLVLAERRLELGAYVDLLTLPGKAERPDGSRGETLPLLAAVEPSRRRPAARATGRRPSRRSAPPPG